MDADRSDDPLEAVYDPVTMRAIDRDPEAVEAHAIETLRGSRRAVTGAALLTASLTGVGDLLDPEPAEIIEELEDYVITGGPDDPVTLFYVPHNPYLSRAIVRPWLFDVKDDAEGAT